VIAALKAEFRKLLTVRSTYILTGLALAFVVFYAGYIEGFKLTGKELLNPHLLSQDIVGAIGSLPLVLGVIVAILLMTHEYRYNTVMYTLTSSNSRSKVLLAKILALTIFGLVFTAVVGALSPLMSLAGIHLHGDGALLAPQAVDYGSLVWRSLFNGWAYIMIGLLLATLIRNQIGAIVSLFVIPTVEQVLGLLLKDNVVYLPFNALNAVLTAPPKGGISYFHAAVVVAVYLVIGWVIAWVLFLKRDAN